MIRPLLLILTIMVVVFQDKISICMWLVGLVGYLSYEFKNEKL
jgi:hypothetical protein